jgi:hypothetical protein
LIGAMLALTVRYLYTERIFEQDIWTAAGRRHLGLYVAGFVLWTAGMRFFSVRFFLRSTAVIAVIYACAAVGPLAVGSAALLLFACFVAGRNLIADRLIALVAGIAVVVFILGFLVQIPVNYWWSYAGAVAVLLASRPLFTLACAREVGELWNLASDRSAAPRFYVESLAFLLGAHFLVVLKPEVSADGLALHLVVPATIADQHLWNFPYQHVVWAVMPMAGDWLFTGGYLLGGEFAARLLNFGMLLVVISAVYALAVRCTSRPAALLAATMFASSPLVHHLTGSLLVENVWTAFLLGGLLAGLKAKEEGGDRTGLLSAALLGAAVAAKFGAISYVVAALPFVVRRKQALLFTGVLLLFALPPYANAFLRTGNPVFPFFNSVFNSPYVEAGPDIIDRRFHQPVGPDILKRVVFNTHLFMESHDGAVGFQYFTFFPLLLLTLGKRWPRTSVACLTVSVVAFLVTIKGTSNVRYAYPVFALASVLIAYTVERTVRSSAFLGRTLAVAGLMLAAVNVSVLQAAGWYHRDFFLNSVFDRRQTEWYLEHSAPSRFLIETLNKIAPGQPVAFLGISEYAGLRATVWTNTWHHWRFAEAMQQAEDAEAVAGWMKQRGIQWFVSSADPARLSSPSVVNFLQTHTTVVEKRHGVELRRLQPAGRTLTLYLESGIHDDTAAALTYRGRWSRGDQFTSAYQSTVTYSERVGDTVRLIFDGESVSWIYTKAFNRGMAQVSIDGKNMGVVDLYSPAIAWKVRSDFRKLGKGRHELIIQVLGKKDARAEAAFVDIDAIDVR